MWLNALRQWVKGKKEHIRKAKRSRRRFRSCPAIKQLEARLAPAVIATVNTLLDTNASNLNSGPCDSSGDISLRSAIEWANATNQTGTIDFSGSLTGTINISSLGTLDITDTGCLTIDGTGQGAPNITVSGGGIVQVFNISSGATVAINCLAIQDGRITGKTDGGGVSNAGTLTLSNDTITDSGTHFLVPPEGDSSFDGKGGGIYNTGTLTLTNDAITDNQALEGGGIYNSGGCLILCNDTITNNSVESKGQGGGIYNSGGNLTLTDSTIAYNSVLFGHGGGIFNSGGILQIALEKAKLE
jgi:fibronectin-binding autotransporter adhesin